MARAPERLASLVETVLGRSREPEGEGSEERSSASIAGADGEVPAAPDAGTGTAFDPAIVSVLGEKVLLAWLRNRHQLLFPFAVDMRRLDEPQADLVRQAMIVAALADGIPDRKERERIAAALRLFDPSDDGRGLDAMLADPKPLNQVLDQVRDVQTGALVYAASLMVIDQRKPVNRHYLRYLAARLQLSEELVGSLEQRFRSSS